jgi:hypothetical protein
MPVNPSIAVADSMEAMCNRSRYLRVAA